MGHDDDHEDAAHQDGNVPLYCRPFQRQKWGEAQILPHTECKYSIRCSTSNDLNATVDSSGLSDELRLLSRCIQGGTLSLIFSM